MNAPLTSVPTIAAVELKRWMDEHRDFILIDTLPPEDYQESHLPNARNACVYEITFLDQVGAITGDKQKTIVLYGSSAHSLASSVAAAKLTEAGYGKLHDFRAGIDGWRNAGYSMEGRPETKRQSPTLSDKTYKVDAATSAIEWVGRNLANKHTGTLQVSEGDLAVHGGRVVSGHFVIDMNTITDLDIPDKSYAQVLVNHLKSEDFFDVGRHPTARFMITRADPIVPQTPGSSNYTILGNFMLKGIEREIDFPALIGATEDGELVAQAHFDLDRTEWNVLYGSGRFFENLGKHLVNDLLSIQLKIVAQ